MQYLLVILLALSLTTCESVYPEDIEKATPQSIIIGQWCSPDIDFSRVERLEIDNTQQRQYIFMLGGLSKFFEKMSIEFFEDGITKDSYLIATQLPGEKECHKEFGEYELRANGKRLIMHDIKTRDRINIEIQKISKDTMLWRIPFSDLVKFGAKGMSLKWMEGPPDFDTYITLKKQ